MTGDPGPKPAGFTRRDGCLRPALTILVLAALVSCVLLGGVVAAARRPGGIALSLGSLQLSVETRLDTFRISYAYQFSGLDGPCLQEETLVLIYDPLEVRRIPGCHCTIAGPDFTPVTILCEQQGVR